MQLSIYCILKMNEILAELIILLILFPLWGLKARYSISNLTPTLGSKRKNIKIVFLAVLANQGQHYQVTQGRRYRPAIPVPLW